MSPKSPDYTPGSFEEGPRRTMPPPELWDRAPPASVSQLVLSELHTEPPLLRHAGPRAELAHQFSRAAACAQAGDSAGEREAYLAIAKVLTARATELDTATAAARKALSIGDDPAVRAELGSWLSGLGEPALAAAALRGIEVEKASEAARNRLKIAVLLGRAGDALGAADALREAADIEPMDGLSLELLGMLASWAPEDVTPETAAIAYGQAAERRADGNEDDAALEDRLRAFEIAPEHEAAARALASAVGVENPAAADEVMRAHAAAIGVNDAVQALAIHRERMRTAAAEGDAGRAVGALLDAWLDGDVGGEHAEEADTVLLSAGLGELVAARLALYAEERDGEARAAAYLALGKLCAGSLASPERAADAFAEAFVTDPRMTEAMTLLGHLGEDTHDPWPLVEALVRVGVPPHRSYAEANQGAARIAALQELSGLAEDKLSDPHLASWALRRLVEAGASAGVGARLDRLSPRLRLQEDAFEQALGRLAAAEEPAERVLTLRRALAFYRGRPDEADTYFKLARELWELAPSDMSAAEDVVRAAARAQKEDALVELLRKDAEARAGRDVAGHARDLLRLCRLLRRNGDEAAALAELVAALSEPDVADSVASTALVHACRARAVRERAEALAVLAGNATPPVAAAMLAVAVDLWMLAGDGERALAVTVRAVRTDTASRRAVVARAAASLGRPDRESVEAVEQAIEAVVPRGVLCDALSGALEEMGERELSFGWTQRWLALRPASPDVSELLLRRALAFGDATALADALTAVLSQPRPLTELGGLAADVLDALLAVDKAKAVALARRVLDVLGPRDATLRARLVGLAERAGDAALAITVLERWIATELEGEEAATAAMDLAVRRAKNGDYAAAARLFARAAAAGHDPAAVLEALEPLVPEVEAKLAEATPAAGALFSDALVFLAEARAGALFVLGPERAGEASFAFRVWGGLLWDLANDPVGAENAFHLASTLVPDGVERYARDLKEFTGALGAVEAVLARAAALAEDPANDKRRAALLIEAANVAQDAGQHERALECASAAIDIDPSRTDAVAIIERSAHVEGGVALLDSTYDKLAAAALGKYGRRAAHYRGARQLERRGAVEPALRHAIESFEAVPTEGTTYVLLARLAERAGDPTDAVRALLRVAEAADPGARPVWLKRAATLAGRSEEGLRMRFDILLRSLVSRPDLGSITDVAAALRDLIAATGDHETPSLRVDRAMRALLPKLDGPDGARAGVALARLAIESLNDLPLAIQAVEQAFAADGDIEDFLTLADLVPHFTADPEASANLVTAVGAAASKPYSSVGTSLLQFTSSLAEALGDIEGAAILLIEAAKRSPDDDELVQRADAAALAIGTSELAQAIELAIPHTARIEALMRIAEKAEPAGQDALAIAALSRVLDLGPDGAEARERTVAWLRRLFAMAGRPEAIEELLRNELLRTDLRPAARVRYARDLGAILSGRGHHTRALDVLAEALAGTHLEEDALADLKRFGRRSRDVRAVADALAKMLGAAPDDETRATLEREIAAVSEAQAQAHDAAGMEGPSSMARAELDSQVLEALEQDANRRGDHAAVAEFLQRRIAIAEVPDVRRMLRLRRAAVLEQRLARAAEAGEELSAQLAETPDDVIALRYLGDMRERSGDPLGAAELWDRLAHIAPTTDEKAEYGIRTTANLVAGGDLTRARETLERIAPIASRESVIELRAQIARQEGDFAALSSALDQLASSSRESPSRRAELLVEAARAAAAAGDDAGALERARRALKLAPDSPETVLETVRAEYRMRGAGTPREAQATTTELLRIAERVPDAHLDLHAFLLAEVMDVIQGGGAGMRELSRRHAEVGALPLIALGMAERLVRSKTFEPAVPLFETALAGDLRGLRARGRVALAAAEAAASSGDIEHARALLQLAAAEPDTRALALRREADLRSGFDVRAHDPHPPPLPVTAPPPEPPPSEPPPAPFPAPPRAMGTPPPLPPSEPDPHAAPPPAEPPPAEPPPAEPHAEPPPSHDPTPSSSEPVPSSQITELDPPDLEDFETVIGAPAIDVDALALRAALDAAEAAFPSSAVSSGDRADADPDTSGDDGGPTSDSAPLPDPTALAAGLEAAASSRVVAAHAAAAAAPPPLPASSGRAGPPPLPAFQTSAALPSFGPSSFPPPEEGDELALRRELLAGSFEAGEQLIAMYAANPGMRSRDILAVRRQQAAIRTGDLVALARLHEAASYDGNQPYANAVEHVLGVFDSAGGLAPPPLAAQRDAPALVSSLLFRQVDSLVNEALAIVWETGLYRRDAASYGLTGVERVQPNGATPLGDVLAGLLRLFGLGRVWLFHRRTPGALRAEVALLASPSVVLSGDVAIETPALLYALGSHLTGAMPEHALVNGMPEEEIRTLIEALLAAFGPLDAAPRATRSNVVRLEQSLWQLIPPRAERRLREICAHPEAFTYDAAVQGTRQAMRRAGLFASGSLSTAVRIAAAESDYDLEPLRAQPDGLARACTENAAIADLVRLAIRTEYAEARWLPPRSEQGPESRRSRYA